MIESPTERATEHSSAVNVDRIGAGLDVPPTLEDWSRALQSLNTVVSTPCPGTGEPGTVTRWEPSEEMLDKAFHQWDRLRNIYYRS